MAMACLPHGASAETCQQLRDAGVRVVDFSADFRLSSQSVYEEWYDVTHPWPEMIGRVPYGLPELFADEIQSADLVANPGCYPTSAILPLAPLIKAELIQSSDIIVDSKTGVSGAGRTPKLGTLYGEVNESMAAYNVGRHRHGPGNRRIWCIDIPARKFNLFSPRIWYQCIAVFCRQFTCVPKPARQRIK